MAPFLFAPGSGQKHDIYQKPAAFITMAAFLSDTYIYHIGGIHSQHGQSLGP